MTGTSVEGLTFGFLLYKVLPTSQIIGQNMNLDEYILC